MDSIAEIVNFLKRIYVAQGKTKGVIAVSGGIDSAVSLTLLSKALGPAAVHPLFLPYGEQSVEDSQLIAKWNQIPEENWETVDIKPAVDTLTATLEIGDVTDDVARQRRGNIMARVRMIVVFDAAKALDALVCGTENKSEHYLGYFTRFGDAASDVEPICQLYKTQVRTIASKLGIPQVFLDKAPTAGLWENQTDEDEMGFSYSDADQVLAVLLGESNAALDPTLLAKVKKVMDTQAFKRIVPYSALGTQ